jgi:membrane protein YqaA with SNARE-associated domain
LLAKLTEFLVALGPWGILLVSFIDSAGIPLTVGLDILVVLLAAKQPHMTALWVALAVIGSSAGNLFLFHVSRKGGEKLLKVEAPEGRRRQFRRWFNRYGLLTIFIPALIPIPMPMKFFVVCCGMLGTHRIHFLATIVLARLLRYGGEAYLGMQMGEHSTRYVAQHSKQLAAIAVLLFVVLYLLIRIADRRRKPVI